MLRDSTKILSFAVKREIFDSSIIATCGEWKDVLTRKLCKKLVSKDGAGQEAMGGTEWRVLILTKVNQDPRSHSIPKQEKHLDRIGRYLP